MSYELLITSSYMSIKSSDLPVTSSTLQFTSCQSKPTSYQFKPTSHKFKYMSLIPGVTSLNLQVLSSKPPVRKLKARHTS